MSDTRAPRHASPNQLSGFVRWLVLIRSGFLGNARRPARRAANLIKVLTGSFERLLGGGGTASGRHAPSTRESILKSEEIQI
jgi:hypothetical protein